MREQPIEKYFCKRVAEEGGRAYKWVSPGYRGVPDRIAFLRGIIYLVELKATNGVLSPLQKAQHKELKRLGYDVIVISSKQQVDEFIAACTAYNSHIQFVASDDAPRGLEKYYGSEWGGDNGQ